MHEVKDMVDLQGPFFFFTSNDTNSCAVSLQGFSKEAPSGAGMDFLIEHKG